MASQSLFEQLNKRRCVNIESNVNYHLVKFILISKKLFYNISLDAHKQTSIFYENIKKKKQTQFITIKIRLIKKVLFSPLNLQINIKYNSTSLN